MDIEDIKKILPHREPMLLVDEVYLNEDGSATGYYTVKGDEFFFLDFVLTKEKTPVRLKVPQKVIDYIATL